jgi:hypothetical protein
LIQVNREKPVVAGQRMKNVTRTLIRSDCCDARFTSELGQSRPKWAVRAMSVFPLAATELRTSRIGSFVPTVDIAGVSFWIFAPIANRLKRRPELTVNT